MKAANEEVRMSAKLNRVPHWRIAKELGISEFTLTRKLREELSLEEQNKVLAIIEKLKEE